MQFHEALKGNRVYVDESLSNFHEEATLGNFLQNCSTEGYILQSTDSQVDDKNFTGWHHFDWVNLVPKICALLVPPSGPSSEVITSLGIAVEPKRKNCGEELCHRLSLSVENQIPSLKG